MDVTVLRGEAPKNGYWDGSGSGYGYGDGYGYGYGSGDGYGDGYGDGDDLIACNPSPVLVTADHLKRGDACSSEVRRFLKTFPLGGTWPNDITQAVAAGLDVDWCRKLGLLRPIGDIK